MHLPTAPWLAALKRVLQARLVSPPRAPHSLSPLFVSVLLLFLPWLALFAPLLPQLAQRFAGLPTVDHYGTQWFYWLVGDALAQGHLPLHTDRLFHPWGKDLLTHTGANYLDALLAWPFRQLLGPVAGYNLFLLAILVFNGLAFHRLARDYLPRGLALWLSLLFATAPFALGEAAEGRPMQAMLGMIPLYLQQVLRLAHPRPRGAPLKAGLLLALLGFQYWFYGLFGGLLLGVQLLRMAWLRLETASSRPRVMLRHLLAGGLALLLVSPLALPLLGQLREASVPGLLEVASWSWLEAPPRTREGHAVELNTWQPLLGEVGILQMDSGGGLTYRPARDCLSLGLALALGGWLWLRIGGWRNRRATRLRPGQTDLARPSAHCLEADLQWLPPGGYPGLLLLALLPLLISIGPVLMLGALGLPNPIYIGLVKLLPPLQRWWWPARALAFVEPLAWLMVGGSLLRWGRSRSAAPAQPVEMATESRGIGLPALVLPLALGAQLVGLWSGGLLPFPSWDATIPQAWQCLAEGPPGAVLELPWRFTQAHLYYQTAHGRPILGGMLEADDAFLPAPLRSYRRENLFLASLLALAAGEVPEARPGDPAVGQARQAFQGLGYRYMLLQKDAWAETGRSGLEAASRRAGLRRALEALGEWLGPPVWEDSRAALYSLDGSGAPCGVKGGRPGDAQAGRGSGAGQLRSTAAEEAEAGREGGSRGVSSPRPVRRWWKE